MTIYTVALICLILAAIWTFVVTFRLGKSKLLLRFVKNFIGVFLIFSAVVKLVDPIGFSIKLDEYFDEFSIPFLQPLSLFLSIVVLVFEFVLGVALLFNSGKKFVYHIALLLMLFFTVLTGASAIFNVVQDCGCFGDFLKLSPWTSFAKDIVLTVLLLWLFINRKKVPSFFKSFSPNGLTLSLGTVAGLAFALHNVFNLPVVDFRPYKEGVNIVEKMQPIKDAVYQNILTYKNKTTGETKAFINTFPENRDEWEWVKTDTKIIDEGIEAPIHDFNISMGGEDITDALLSFEKPVVLFTFTGVEKIKNRGVNAMKKLIESSNTDGTFNYAFLTAVTSPDWEKYSAENELEGDLLTIDGTTLKTIIRSNPGMILLKEGNIVDKWHYRHFPTVGVVNEQIKHFD